MGYVVMDLTAVITSCVVVALFAGGFIAITILLFFWKKNNLAQKQCLARATAHFQEAQANLIEARKGLEALKAEREANKALVNMAKDLSQSVRKRLNIIQTNTLLSRDIQDTLLQRELNRQKQLLERKKALSEAIPSILEVEAEVEEVQAPKARKHSSVLVRGLKGAGNIIGFRPDKQGLEEVDGDSSPTLAMYEADRKHSAVSMQELERDHESIKEMVDALHNSLDVETPQLPRCRSAVLCSTAPLTRADKLRKLSVANNTHDWENSP